MLAGSVVEIAWAQELEGAIELLKTGADLVVCGLHFDDSRMFDLLRIAKSDPATRDIPFVCLRDLDTALPPPLVEGLQIACKTCRSCR